MPSIRTSLCATALQIVSIIGHVTGDPHADWFMIAGFVVLGIGPSFREPRA